VEAAFERAWDLSVARDALPEQFLALAGLYAFNLTRCRLARASEEAARMLEIAERLPVPTLALMGNAFAGMARYLAGELGSARVLLERALTFAAGQPPGVQTDFAVMAGSHLACALAIQGFPDQARRADAAACARASTSTRYDQTVAIFCSSGIAAMLGDPAAAERAAAEAIDLTETHGFPMWLPSARVVHGWAVAVARRDPAGASEAEAGATGLDEVGFERDRTFLLGLLADALAAVGRRPEALATVDQALERVARNGERYAEADLWRRKGELLGPAHPEAEACLRRAIEVARAYGARWWELRAAVSLARLGGAGEAVRAVREILGAFTEGADTADVRAARAIAGGGASPV
jgi:tetratricopeptide (TPR) repeat protein